MDKLNTPEIYAYTRYRKGRIQKQSGIITGSLATVSREYCAESSICGLKHLVAKDTPLLERLLWVVILIVGLGCSVSLVQMTFIKYYRAPLVTTQMPEGVSVSKIIFPAVGICSNNRISKRAVMELAKRLLQEQRNKQYSEEDMMSLLFGLGQLYQLRLNHTDSVDQMKLHHALGTYDVHQLLKSIYELEPDEIHFASNRVQVKNVIEHRACKYIAKHVIKYEGSLPPKRRNNETNLLFDIMTIDEALDDKNIFCDAIGTEAKLTPSCEDLLVRCVWNTEIINCHELFDFRLTVNGYCCTFNYLRMSDTKFSDKNMETRSDDSYHHGNKSTFDFDQGLKIMLRFNESDDFFYNIPLQGAQLQFSDAYDFPDAPSGSYAMQIVNPGVQMTVMVSASFTEASRDIQHVSLALRKCRFHDESTYLTYYTYSDCMLKCRMQFLLENCDCTPFNMPKEDTARTCDIRDVACLSTFYAQSITVRPKVEPIPMELELDLVGGGVDCPECSPSCSKTDYSYDFNNVNIYEDYLNVVPDDNREDWLRGANFSGTSLVHVKYAKESAECYGRNVIMKWFDLISNIGSTCGFVTGFSFVSVIEFIYFFTVKFFREIQLRRSHKWSFGNKGVGSFEPDRSIYWNELTQSTSYANFHKNG